MAATVNKRPLSLQARLMAAVIGFVSLILAIVAIITSVALGVALEGRLDAQLDTQSSRTTAWTEQVMHTDPLRVTPGNVLSEQRVPSSGILYAVHAPGNDPSGAIVDTDGRLHSLTSLQMRVVDLAVRTNAHSTTTIPGVGSFRLTVDETPSGALVVTGMPRTDIQQTTAGLFTVIALATLGGLILLAITTAVTISVGLRPLRDIAATATRVADQPLDRGEVSITERVPDEQSDPRTETGMVGSALNTLLDHVDTSLAARQQNEERMRRFVADASHELRTPLSSIRGYSELSLRDTGLPENAQTALERIQAQSLRMTTLVEDLLLLARLDEGRELSHSPTDLAQIAVEEVADARPTAPHHHWELDVPAEEIIVDGDAGRLHQVITNLLANARTHTPEGTTITLSRARTESVAELRVHDNGPGIDPAVREELFSRFARGDASRARKTGGTGLGLAIVKAIVEGHDGTITVESTPGDTTFIVRIPLSAVPASQ